MTHRSSYRIYLSLFYHIMNPDEENSIIVGVMSGGDKNFTKSTRDALIST